MGLTGDANAYNTPMMDHTCICMSRIHTYTEMKFDLKCFIPYVHGICSVYSILKLWGALKNMKKKLDDLGLTVLRCVFFPYR